MKRCEYVNLENPAYVAYHDDEWGRPLHDDRALFELLTLECFQAGLSWECVLNKREGFRQAYEGFDPARVAAFDDAKVSQLLGDAGIVRNRLKVAASISNAQAFLQIQKEFGSFDAYLWGFTDGEVQHIDFHAETSSALSDAISKDLKRRGMKFVGTTIVYSYLQAAGIIDAHSAACDLYEPRVSIRNAAKADLPFILEENAANVEVLAPLDEDKLIRMRDEAAFVWVAEANRMPAAFLMAFRPGAAYSSENYRWFSARHDDFLYIDRVVIAQPYRRLGIGRALYAKAISHARELGVPVLTAEIDLEPVFNATSLAFHAAMGFCEVSTMRLSDGKTLVSLQELDLGSA